MRTGSSFSKQGARPTELGLTAVVGGSVRLHMIKTISSSVVCSRPLPDRSLMSERDGRLFEGQHAKHSCGRTDGRPINMYSIMALHVCSVCCYRSQSACE